MHSSVENYYSQNIENLTSFLKKIRKTIAWLYLARLLTFLLVIAFIVLFIKFNNNSIYLIFSLITFIVFLLLVKFDLIFSWKEKFNTHKMVVNENELKFLNHQYLDRPTGDEYTHLNPHLAADFDIFGKASLFQYLNRCSTVAGKTRLAEGLSHSHTDPTLILKKQQSIKELSGKQNLSQDFQAYGMFIFENGNEIEHLQAWLNETDEKIKLLKILNLVVPLMNLIWYILVALGIFSISSLGLSILLSLAIVGFNKKRIGKAHDQLGKTAKTFEKYTALIRLIENENFHSDYLRELQQKLTVNDCKASDSLSELFKLLNSFDIRYNLIVSFLLNAILIFDIQVFCRMEKWKTKHKNSIASWFNTLSETDMLISYASHAFNNQAEVSYPNISEAEFRFKAEEMGHPLLHSNVRINNTVELNGMPAVMIITGANMAGKSTFLRTMAINLILGMNGAPVCAKSFVFSPCDILSSIKIQDSLANNESYFYAELLRLKEIIEHVKSHPKTFVILDEILRGTNTRDKQLGSLGLLEKLISQHAVVILATHDVSIGELEKKYPGIVTNHCFEVELTNDQLIFDYKLKNGISQKLNASFLMEKMGIMS